MTDFSGLDDGVLDKAWWGIVAAILALSMYGPALSSVSAWRARPMPQSIIMLSPRVRGLDWRSGTGMDAKAKLVLGCLEWRGARL